MKIKEDKWLTFDDTNKGWMEIKRDDLNYWTDTYKPWQVKQRLKIGREVELTAWGWVKTLTFSKLASWWLETVQYTGFGFIPREVLIKAVPTAVTTPAAFSDVSILENWTPAWFRIGDGDSNDISTRAIAVYNSGNITRANFDDFIAGWIELTYINSDIDIKIIMTAYS